MIRVGHATRQHQQIEIVWVGVLNAHSPLNVWSGSKCLNLESLNPQVWARLTPPLRHAVREIPQAWYTRPLRPSVINTATHFPCNSLKGFLYKTPEVRRETAPMWVMIVGKISMSTCNTVGQGTPTSTKKSILRRLYWRMS